MSYRTVRAHFGLFKIAYTLVFMVLCIFLGLTLVTVGTLCLVGVFEMDLSSPLMIKGGVVLVLWGIAPVHWYGPSFAVLFKLAACDRALRNSRYGEADAHANRAWHYAQSLRPSDPLYGMTLEHLTRVARAQGNYDDAESYGQKWVWASEQAWGSEHRNVFHATREYADVYLDIARYDQAKPLLEKVLAFWESTSSPDPVAMALCLGSLGRVWQILARNDKAEPFLRRAYAIVQQLRRDDSFAGMTITHNLASACAHLGKLDEAETLVRTFLERIEKIFSPDSHIVAATLYQFALIRLLQRRFAEGEPMARRALAIIEKIARNNELELATYFSLLGKLLTALGKLDEAEVLLRLALRSREEYLAPEHPFVAESLESYAHVLKALGRVMEANEFIHRAGQIRDFHARLRND